MLSTFGTITRPGASTISYGKPSSRSTPMRPSRMAGEGVPDTDHFPHTADFAVSHGQWGIPRPASPSFPTSRQTGGYASVPNVTNGTLRSNNPFATSNSTGGAADEYYRMRGHEPSEGPRAHYRHGYNPRGSHQPPPHAYPGVSGHTSDMPSQAEVESAPLVSQYDVKLVAPQNAAPTVAEEGGRAEWETENQQDHSTAPIPSHRFPAQTPHSIPQTSLAPDQSQVSYREPQGEDLVVIEARSQNPPATDQDQDQSEGGHPSATYVGVDGLESGLVQKRVQELSKKMGAVPLGSAGVASPAPSMVSVASTQNAADGGTRRKDIQPDPTALPSNSDYAETTVNPPDPTLQNVEGMLDRWQKDPQSRSHAANALSRMLRDQCAETEEFRHRNIQLKEHKKALHSALEAAEKSRDEMINNTRSLMSEFQALSAHNAALTAFSNILVKEFSLSNSENTTLRHQVDVLTKARQETLSKLGRLEAAQTVEDANALMSRLESKYQRLYSQDSRGQRHRF